MKEIKAMTIEELIDYQSNFNSSAKEYKLIEAEIRRKEILPASSKAMLAIYISLASLALSALAIWLKLN